jgi:hypothetical protein
MKESEVHPNPKTDDDFADLLKGGEAIATYIGESYRTTVYSSPQSNSPAGRLALSGTAPSGRFALAFSVRSRRDE